MKKILIWGTGYQAEKCIPNIDKENTVVLGCIETNPQKKVWKEWTVYPAESISELEYDYIIIANTYYDEILGYVKEKGLADEGKLIDWMKIKKEICCKEGAWGLFSRQFLGINLYAFKTDEKKQFTNLPEKLNKYNKIYIYDLRLLDSELHIGQLIGDVLDNLKNPGTGMAFIPNEDLMAENWYHNLLCVLDRHALVIWSELEGVFERCIRNELEKFSFMKFETLQFKNAAMRVVHKGRYMMLDTEWVYREKREEINNADHIRICYLQSGRIGEEIRRLNYIRLERGRVQDTFELYIPVCIDCQPFEGANICFNELVGRKINLLKNREDYALLLQDMFERSEKYEHDFRWEYRHPFRSYPCSIKNSSTPDIDFYDDELALGKKLIKNRLGLEGDYVGLFTRDAEYLNRLVPTGYWSYHDYRDVSFDVMCKAIDYFENCGVRTVRLGQVTEQKTIHGNCVDFAENGYDEFIDLMLHRFCKFFLGCAAGIAAIPHFFGRPTALLVPYYPPLEFAYTWRERDLCIFNRVYSVEGQRELSFSEIFDVAYEFQTKGDYNGKYFAEHGLQLIPFLQEDILDFAMEMNEKLDGVWQCGDEDAKLHDEFDLQLEYFFDKYKINTSNALMVPVATSFLRRYKYLL